MSLNRVSRGRFLVLCAALLAAPPAFAALKPGPAAPLIAQMVARILETDHYDHHPLDAATSKDLLNNYLQMYDYNRMFFEKKDIEEFKARYGDTLAQRIKEGDVEPAFVIFNRFLDRLQERRELVDRLADSTMDFTTDETMALDRHEAPWPDGKREVDELWRKRVKYETLQEMLSKTKPAEIAKTIKTRYEGLLRSYQEYDSSDILQNYLTALTRTFDPHSDYMAAPEMENFNISMRLSLVGIGAVLRSEDGYAKIVSLVPGGPAARDKRLKPNDRIEAIAQGDGPWMEAVGMKLDRLVQMIRGKKGTVVRLRVLPADALDPSTKVVISLTRDEIKLTDQEAKAEIISMPEAAGKKLKVGVVDLPSFYADMKSVVDPKSTTRDVAALVSYMEKQGIDGLIIDLRNNGGGSLSESVALCGLFIPEGGPVVQIKDARGLIKELRTEDSMIYSGPLLVLTSRASASASEIFTAAMQDYGRAAVVGNKSTFGKGTVQSIIELGQYLPAELRSMRPGAVKLTIQKFYRVSGGSTQHRGVIPDIQLPSLEDYMDIAESALHHPMPYDEVKPAKYRRLNFVTRAEFKALAALSARRVDESQEFQWLREDIKRFKKQKDEKTISLNEAQRLAEKKADDAREAERKKARAARKPDGLSFAEITLEQIESGKPPVTSTSTVALQADDAQEAGAADYRRAPPPPDFVLDEAADIVADMVARGDGTASRASTAGRKLAP